LFPDQKIIEAYRKVTLEQLLVHAGGFAANVEDPAPYDWNLEPQRARNIYLEQALQSQPIGQAGAEFSYSNMGYIVAAIAAERATGKTWEQLIRQTILEPLQMNGCDFGTRFKALTQPHGHTLNFLKRLTAVSPEQPNGNSPVMYGADGLRCSLADMGKYLVAHINGGRDQAGVISNSSFTFLHKPRLESGNGSRAGLGWFVQDGLLLHAGSNTINYAMVVINPKRNSGVFMATNAPTDLGNVAVDDLFEALAQWPKK
jgi:D-alanyl-D-alanine carboxypeptidase